MRRGNYDHGYESVVLTENTTGVLWYSILDRWFSFSFLRLCHYYRLTTCQGIVTVTTAASEWYLMRSEIQGG